MQAVGGAAPASVLCNACGQQNAANMRFCGACGAALGVPAPTDPYQQPPYRQPTPQYTQQPYAQPQQYNQPIPQYNQQPYAQPAPQYGQQPYYSQGGYQPQPMVGQGQMVLRCPTCMAMAPVGSPACRSCHTSLLNIVPTPANGPMQGQQGGFLQGDAGKYAIGALGGAAALFAGEQLFNGLENSIENRVEDDMGYGGNQHHRHHHQGEGLLGELGRLADDVGL